MIQHLFVRLEGLGARLRHESFFRVRDDNAAAFSFLLEPVFFKNHGSLILLLLFVATVVFFAAFAVFFAAIVIFCVVAAVFVGLPIFLLIIHRFVVLLARSRLFEHDSRSRAVSTLLIRVPAVKLSQHKPHICLSDSVAGTGLTRRR